MKTYTTHKPLIEIDSGDFNRILEISQDLVAKVPLAASVTSRVLRRESEIMADLKDCGISVPRVLGFYNIVIDPSLSIRSYGIVMQRLRGCTALKLEKNLINRVEEMMEAELRKCKLAGFIPYDEGLHNTFYSPAEDRIYLIDFQGWKRRKF